MNTPPVETLSEELVSQIEAHFEISNDSMFARSYIPALCQSLRATRADLRALRQQVEDTVIVAKTNEDAEGFISAYHFQTGAIHRLLAEARKGG